VLNIRYRSHVLAMLVPALLLGGAYISQYYFGLAPCEMCYWQRWPHMAAVGLGLVAFGLRARPQSWWFVMAAAIAIAISGLIGVFHAGVEYDWWEGLTACSTVGAMEPGSILNSQLSDRVVRCDEAQWTMFGISLAGFNALFSLGAAALILLGIRRAARPAL
jgi:disulfide bond formation protein DsbB